MSNRVTEEWLRANYPDADAVLSRRAAEAAAPPPPDPKPRRSKYGAVPTTYKGIRYASKAEAVRAERLDFDVSAGLVRFWIGQPRFRLGVAENVYVADFFVVYTFADKTTGVRVEDVKGVDTPKFLHDVKLWRRYGPCELWIVRNGKVEEIVSPDGKEVT